MSSRPDKTRRLFICVNMLVLAATTPITAWAQAGWYLTPSLIATEEFDDNVFLSSSNREADFISRFSPGLKVGYESRPFTLLATGGIDAEYFAEHSELSGAANRKRAGLELRYVPRLMGPTTTLGFNAVYAETQTPSELQPQTGIESGRRTTRSWSASPSLTHRFTTLTSGNASYSYGEIVSGAFTSVTQQATLGLSSQLSRLDTGTLRYTLGITDSGEDSTTSHALTMGWISKLSRSTTLSLEAGPRLTDGTLEPQVRAGLAHQFRTGEVTLTYERAETVVIGEAGTAETNSVLAGLTLSLTRRLQAILGSGYSVTTLPRGGDVTVYRANASVSYRLAKWLGISAGYRFSHQDQAGALLEHNVFSISLDAVYPIRMD